MRRLLWVLAMLGAVSGADASAAPASLDERFAEAREIYLELGAQAALPHFERVLELYRQAGDRRGEAITLGYIGNCYKRFADYPRALELLHQALGIKRAIGDRLEEGKTLSHLGLVYWNMSEYPKAIEHFERSIEVGRELGDAQLEGSALNNLSLVYDEQGDYRRSLEGYQRVLGLYRGIDFPRGEGDTLGNIGGVYLFLGQYREAMGYFRQALAISERLGHRAAMSIDLGNLATAQSGVGETAEALRSFERALALAREAGLEKEEAVWLQGKAGVLARRGRYDEARASYDLALEVYEKAGLQRELVEGLAETGNLYMLLGDVAFADRSFRRGIALAREIGHPLGVTINLVALGDLERRRDRLEEAAALYREASVRAREAGLQAHVADGLVRLAHTFREQGRLDDALAEARRALEIARSIHARPAEAEALYTLGEVARDQGRLEEAMERYAGSRRIVDASGGAELGWRVLFGRGQALEQMGRDTEAVEAYRQAASAIETTRSQLRQERFRSGYLGDKYEVYVALVRLLVKLERPEEAFHFSEKLRAHSYARLVAASGPPIRSPEQRRREAELRQRIRQLHRVIEEERARPDTEKRRAATALFSSELLAAEHAYEEFLDDLRASEAAVSEAMTLAVPSAETVQAALPEDAALVEYVVGDEGVLVLVIKATEAHALEVEFPRADLTAGVELLRGLILRSDSSLWERSAARLRQRLLQPVEDSGWLQGIERLYIVPHDILHYVPFAALPGPVGSGGGAARLLIEEYVIVELPSAVLLTEGPAAGTKRSLLAMAPQRANLTYATREVESISGFFREASSVIVGREATEARFKSEAGSHSVLHLATHGYFNKLSPLLSGLELEPDTREDGRLEVHEIMELELRARLVTLSACETALSSGYFTEVPVGDDFVGLARAFLFAGGDTVMASLWEVDDRSTRDLMRSFYSGLERTDPASALALAQRRMRQSDERYSHPYFWAAFVVLGAAR